MSIRTGNATDQMYGYNKRLQRAFDYLGGKCEWCSSTKELEFDHRNRLEKSFGISENICRRWDVLRPELDKCRLLCHSCHVEKTLREDKPTFTKQIAWNKGKKEPPEIVAKRVATRKITMAARK